MRLWLNRLLPFLLAFAALGLQPAPVTAYDCNTVPVGSWSGADPAVQHPIWCVSLPNAAPTTRIIDAQDGWLDDFNSGTQFGHFNNGEVGYRVFDRLGAIQQSQHWLHNNHWMVDMEHNNGGTAIAPQQAFRFENGKLVLETDVAASIPGYMESNGGDIVWPEVVWSTAPAPTGNVVDGLYLYGQFGGAWTAGCRLQAKRSLTCALEADSSIVSSTGGTCFPFPPARLIEISGFQQCGTTHFGFAADMGAPLPSWRSCGSDDPDLMCRDRFRFEWRKDGFTAWVNGVKYAEDSGWPADRQLPDSIVSGQTSVYAYFGEWGDFSDANVYRFHWDRVAVNPHAADGTILSLSAVPNFCPGQPNDTCGSSPTPSPSPTVSPMPSPTPAPFACDLRYDGRRHPGTCQQNADGTITFRAA